MALGATTSLFLHWLFTLCGALLSAMPTYASDLKITYRDTVGDHLHQQTKYIKGERSRFEWRSLAGWAAKPGDPTTYTYGHPVATIYQCDQRRVVSLDLEAREYTSYELDERGLPKGTKPRRLEPSGGTVTITIESIDTGERKEVFGFTARHIIIREKRVASPGAISEGGESERDGWYIDLDVTDSCFHRPGKHTIAVGFLQAGADGKMDKIEVRRSGVEVTGFAVEMTTTTRGQRAMPDSRSEAWTATSKMEVIELSTDPLDPALFEVPPGFKKVRKLNDQPSRPPALQPEGTWNRLKQTLWAIFR